MGLLDNIKTNREVRERKKQQAKIEVEKSIPKVPLFWCNGAWMEHLCTTCRTQTAEWTGSKWIYQEKCGYCGQFLDLVNEEKDFTMNSK